MGKMVYYFTSNVVQPSAFIYVGKDKFESRTAMFQSENILESDDFCGQMRTS